MIIKDGTGSGKRATVTKSNGIGRLHVLSVSSDVEEAAAHNGEAFAIHARCHLAAATSGGLLYIKNTSPDFHYHITREYFNAFALSEDTLIVTQVKEPATVVSGTDISESTSVGIIQKQFGSPKTLAATVVQSDGAADLTFTNGQEMHAFELPSRGKHTMEMRGTNILTPNSTILYGWETTGTATNGEIVSLTINLYRKKLTDPH